MRAAGVREIKNRLSEFLRLVADGETVLVTDHGRVVAQLAPPPAAGAPALTEDEALSRLAAAGKVRLPRGRLRSRGAGPMLEGPVGALPPDVDLQGILDDVRSGG